MIELDQCKCVLSLYEQAENVHPHTFAQQCFHKLHEHLRFETGTLLSLDEASLPNGAYLHNVPSTVVARYFDVVAGTDVQEKYFHELEEKSECAINSLDMFDADVYWKTDIFKDFYLPFNFVHQLGMSVPIGINGYRANMYIDRSRFDDAFTETERQYAEYLMRHLMRALRYNLTIWFNIALNEDKSTAYAVADRKGRILLSQTQFWKITDFAWQKRVAYQLQTLPFVRDDKHYPCTLYRCDKITVTGEALGPYVLLKVVKNILLNQQHLELLTAKERQVAEFIANGYTYKEIADLLNKSYSTVKNQAESIRNKLKVKNLKSLHKLFQ